MSNQSLAVGLGLAVAIASVTGVYIARQSDPLATETAADTTLSSGKLHTTLSRSVVYSPRAAELTADPSPNELARLVQDINTLLQSPDFARETLDSLGDTVQLSGVKAGEAEHYWVKSEESIETASLELAKAMSAQAQPDSNIIRLVMTTQRQGRLGEVLDVHTRRLLLTWRNQATQTQVTLSNLQAQKESLELEIANAVGREKQELNKNLQPHVLNTATPTADQAVLQARRADLLNQLKKLEQSKNKTSPSDQNVAYSTHGHRVLIEDLDRQLSNLREQLDLTPETSPLRASLSQEIRTLSQRLQHLMSEEKQFKAQAVELAQTQHTLQHDAQIQALRKQLKGLDAALASPAPDRQAHKANPALTANELRNRTEQLIEKLGVLEKQISTLREGAYLGYSLEVVG